MKLSQIKVGMVVRISKNLESTSKRWGVTQTMVEMRGNVYNICEANPPCIYNKEKGVYLCFCAEDLSPVQMTPPIAPVLFDPENILNEGK